jgi:hypothetical protein
MKKLVLLGLSVILISSCSIQKRVYLSGYNIDWKSNAKHVETKKIANNKLTNKITPIDVKTILEQNKNEVILNTNELVITASAAKQINQISTKSIKLLTKNTIKTNLSAPAVKVYNYKAAKYNSNLKNNSSTSGADIDWGTAAMCFFFGYLGVHRFMKGDVGMGILYLLTGGLCGIGVIIDLIKILQGKW